MKNDIQQISENILKVSNEVKLDAFSAMNYSNINSLLFNLSKKIISGNNPVVTWNIRPTAEFTLVHAVYCTKIDQLINMGFNCVITIYDKSVEKQIKVHHIELIDEWVENLIANIRNAGLNLDKVEFLLQSDLHKMINIDDFFSFIVSVSTGCDNNHLLKQNQSFSDAFDNFCEVYYEHVIDSDLVITGGDDVKNIWSPLRKVVFDSDILNVYTPPIILFYPTILGIDDYNITTFSGDNSISSLDTEDIISNKLMTSSLSFIHTLYEYLLIPYYSFVKHMGEKYYSYREIRSKLAENVIRQMAIEYTIRYIDKIKGRD